MNASEIRFVLDHASDVGSSLVQAAVREGHPLWKSFFDAGWPQLASKKPRIRREFLDSLVHSKHPEIASEAFRRFFEVSASNMRSILAQRVGGRDLVGWWVHQGALHPEKHATATALLRAARELGVDFNAVRVATLRTGTEVRFTALSEMVGRSLQDSCAEVELLCQHGASFAGLPCVKVVSTGLPAQAREWVEWAVDRGYASLGDFLVHRHHPEAHLPTIALIDALNAQSAIHAIDGAAVAPLAP